MSGIDPDATITIPESAWQNTGPDEDASARLLAHIQINGTSLHLEALAVTDEGKLGQTAVVYDENLDSLATITGEGGMPFTTTEIGGREYVLYAFPFG